MNNRKYPLVNEKYYHLFSRSIAGFKIFNSNIDFVRIIDMLDIYRYKDFIYKYSRFIELEPATRVSLVQSLKVQSETYVDVIAYCIMPTHIHLLLKQNIDNGITKYLGKVLNSYSRYFNVSHKRTGPLWAGHFKNVPISTNEQMLHLTRYIHLNPTSAGLVNAPEDWCYSSYRSYLDDNQAANSFLSNHEELFCLDPKSYRKFVNDQKKYQQDLAIIKNQLIEDYTG